MNLEKQIAIRLCVLGVFILGQGVTLIVADIPIPPGMLWEHARVTIIVALVMVIGLALQKVNE